MTSTKILPNLADLGGERKLKLPRQSSSFLWRCPSKNRALKHQLFHMAPAHVEPFICINSQGRVRRRCGAVCNTCCCQEADTCAEGVSWGLDCADTEKSVRDACQKAQNN